MNLISVWSYHKQMKIRFGDYVSTGSLSDWLRLLIAL